MADREDTDPTAQKGRTDPGLGGPTPPESGKAKAAKPPVPPPVPVRQAAPANGEADVAPVDFDALHAALGANHDAAGRTPAKADAVEVDIETPEAPRVAESQGRSSASYATTHAVQASSSPADADPSVPAVIVENDTNPGAQVTVPLGAPVVPSSGPHLAAAPASSGPHVAAIPSSPMAFTPPGAFPVQRSPGQRTMLMPQRPRRAKSATVVVRARGPSTFQKVAAFTAMLLLVTACGIAVIVWRKPRLLGFEQLPVPSASQAHVVPPGAAPSASVAAVDTVSAAPPVTATAAPSTSASAPVVKKIIAPKPPHSAH